MCLTLVFYAVLGCVGDSAVRRDPGHLGDDRLPTGPGTSPERAQLAWYVVTVVPGFLLMFFAPLPGWGVVIVGLSIPLAIAVGVLRYGMLDIVLRPVIVYGGLTAVVVAVFVTVSALAG